MSILTLTRVPCVYIKPLLKHTWLHAHKRTPHQVGTPYQLTEDSYERYQNFCSAYEAAGKTLGPLVDKACSACRPHWDHDAYIANERVKQLQAENARLQGASNKGFCVVS